MMIKFINFFMALLLSASMNISCSAQEVKENEPAFSQSGAVEVYYFHFTRRCITCNAIESVSKEALKEFYGEKVGFYSLNLDDDKGMEKAKQLEISGQTLLIVSSGKKINLTNEGFMFARSNPDKLKAIIKEKIDSLL